MGIEGAAARPQTPEDARDSAAIASLMDPAALERRLAEARAQREAALAARKAGTGTATARPPRPVTAERPPLPLPPRPQPLPPDPRASDRPAKPIPPLIAERRPPPQPERRRLLPAGVLVGFAAGAVAALGAVVLLEPRLALPTGTGIAPVAAPSATPGPAETVPPVMIAELVVVPPPQASPEATGPDLPEPTPSGAAPSFRASSPAAPASTEPAMTAGPVAPRQEPPAPVRTAALAGPLLAPPAPADASSAQPAPPAEAGAPATAETPANPFADRALRLILHAPTGIPGADVDAALSLLAGAVAPPEGPIGVGYAISRSNVRYYHPEDADAATAAATALSDRLGPVEARDFTGYQPRPNPGTIEVWLSGAPVAAARATAARSAPPQAAPPAAAPAAAGGEPPTVVHDIPGLVARAAQDRTVVEGIPGLVESVVQNQATQSALAARAAAQAEDAARRENGLGSVLRRALGAP